MSRCAVFALVGLLSGAGCLPEGRTVAVSSKMHTESYITANMVSMLLRARGFRVREFFGIGSTINRVALETGQVDLYPEYTGTAWTLYLARPERVADPETLFRRVAEADRARGILWPERTQVNNTYALAIRRGDVARIGATLSALARFQRSRSQALRFAVSHEFHERPDGFQSMARHYGLDLTTAVVRTMDIGLTFDAIARDRVDVAMVFSTDGKIIEYDLHVLADDRQFFPVYNLAFPMRSEVVARHPELPGILSPLVRALQNSSLQQMNYDVDALGLPPEFVAERFLRREGLLEGRARFPD